MDSRAAKLALARKKLKDHQDKKSHENTTNIDTKNAVNFFDSNHHSSNQTPKTEDVQASTVIQQSFNQEAIVSNSNIVELIQPDVLSNYQPPDMDVNATEILISNKRTLELQTNSLQVKLMELENNLATTTYNYELSCQKISNLETDLGNINYKYQTATAELMFKDNAIKELNEIKLTLLDQKTNLQEQLDFTKSILGAKEAENDSLHSQLFNMQNQLDSTQLQLQQLTSGTHPHLSEDKTNALKHENEVLMQKVSNLEQQLKIQTKDYQQLNNHYEHYMGDLNNQLKQVVKKNEELNREIQDLSNRENSLIEQISDMEIRLQNYNRSTVVVNEQSSAIDTAALEEMRNNYEKSQINLQDLNLKFEELQRLYAESRVEVDNLTQSKEADTQDSSENVSLLKLNADITSDKIAAQRATEQNKKLKQDIQGLEDAFVKMTKDKLELTEKITAEKFLNRELTIKLADIDEKANEMQKKLKAKDEEMIRLQTSYRVIEGKYHEIAENLKHLNGHPEPQQEHNCGHEHDHINKEEVTDTESTNHSNCHEHRNSVECEESESIPKHDAMSKLQDRFLKIMDEVADLSDEKHRLEHIITQLQNETDTICEYVALYQQQRCLLKKRDEERTAQIKMFQSECTRLQSQLDELTGILTRFADDKELSSYFQAETKHDDMQKVMNLLSKLKTNSLIDPQKSLKFNDFYPCSCCSGQLIEV